jgi:hypothetical protein
MNGHTMNMTGVHIARGTGIHRGRAHSKPTRPAKYAVDPMSHKHCSVAGARINVFLISDNRILLRGDRQIPRQGFGWRRRQDRHIDCRQPTRQRPEVRSIPTAVILESMSTRWSSGLVDKFSSTYWVLTAAAVALQFLMIALVLHLHKLHFGKLATPGGLAAEQ